MSHRAITPTAVERAAEAGLETDRFRGPGAGRVDYDKVTSMLMAVVMGALMVVALMGVVYMTNQAYASRVTAPLQIIEVAGGGGDARGHARLDGEDRCRRGRPRGPGVEQRGRGRRLRGARRAGDARRDARRRGRGGLGPGRGRPRPGDAPRRPQSPAASAPPSSAPGGPGLGFGPGDGGVAREQRWSIIYNSDQTIEEYARQLDALGVELAVVQDQNQLTYVSHFSAPSPPSATAPARAITASISSGKAEAGRRPTSPCCARRASTSATRSCSSSIPPPPRSSSPSSSAATGAATPARSASPASASSPGETAMASRSWRRRR